MTKSVPAPVNIEIKGNVENGNIVVGDNNFVVNTNHGTIVYQQAKPQVRLRDFAPQSPRAPRGFINRTAELQKLEAWISSNEMVLLHGRDGIGKSSLLKQAANSQAGHDRPNGVIFLESEGTTDQMLGLDDLVQRLFDALFESDPPLKVDANTARTYLSNTRPLVLLDEVPLSQNLQRTLPDLFPNGALLFTSDVALGREDFLRMSIGPLPREASTRLLAEKAGIELNEQNRAALDSICEVLEDVSLAVVLTANVMREIRLTPDATREKIQTLKDSQKTGIDRAYALAFEQLKPEEREILSTAALTPGVSMTPEWLAAAFGSDEAGHFIERLKALGLLVTNSPRLRVPPGIRVPAQASARIDQNDLLRSLADFLIASLKRQPQNWELISEELGNLFGTLAWAIRTGNWRLAVQLGRALDPYLTMRGLWDAWRDVLDLLLDAARQSGDRAAEAFALHQSGVREIGLGLRQRALTLFRQALEIRQSLGDTIGMAYTQHNIDFLMGPPPPPRNNQPKPPSPKPMPAGVKLFLLVSAFGLVGFLGILGLASIFLFPRQTDTPVPYVAPSTAAPVIATDTLTPIPTDTRTPTQRPTRTPTRTAEPTPIGGSGQIAFVSLDPFTEGTSLLYTTTIDDGTLYQVFSDRRVPVSDPAWSPDGKTLALSSRYTQNGSSQIFTVNADGTNLQIVTDGQSNYFHPTWSPNGQRLAFLQYDPEFGSALVSIDPDGSNAFLIAGGDGGLYDYPEYSPDGNRIVYNVQIEDFWEIFVINYDGTGQTQLTFGNAKGISSMNPSWSPDGKRIVFSSNIGGTYGIYTMNADGSDITPVTQDRFYNVFPDWSPDGKMIVYSSTRTEEAMQIYVIGVDGAGKRQVTASQGSSLQADWWPNP